MTDDAPKRPFRYEMSDLLLMVALGGGYMAARHCTEQKVESRAKRLLYFLMVNAMLVCFVGAAVFYILGR